MKPFTELMAIAAPLPLTNVDTDKIIAGRYLKTLTRSGLGKVLFASMRFGEDGQEDPRFILNRRPYRDAGILVARENFGCGSSREHAPWALLDFGIRCVIAPSFADIFFANCFKNGILPICLGAQEVENLLTLTATPRLARLRVSLVEQAIESADGVVHRFEIDPERKRALLEGRDEIAESLTHVQQITRFEQEQRHRAPWIEAIRIDT